MSSDTYDMSDREAYQYAQHKHEQGFRLFIMGVLYLVLTIMYPDTDLVYVFLAVVTVAILILTVINSLALNGVGLCQRLMNRLQSKAGGSPIQWGAFDVEVDYEHK